MNADYQSGYLLGQLFGLAFIALWLMVPIWIYRIMRRLTQIRDGLNGNHKETP